MADIYFGDCN